MGGRRRGDDTVGGVLCAGVFDRAGGVRPDDAAMTLSAGIMAVMGAGLLGGLAGADLAQWVFGGVAGSAPCAPPSPPPAPCST